MAQLYDFPLGVSQHDPYFEKILKIITGFRGYETLDSLKAADGQVRESIARQLGKAMEESRGARERVSGGLHLQVLPDFDRMTGRIRSSREKLQSPVSGRIAGCRDYQPVPGLVGELYALDFKTLTASQNVYNLMQEFARLDREDVILSNIHKIELSLQEIAEADDKKRYVIECMIEK